MAKVPEVKSSEPKVISERICSPAPLWSVKAGMKFFLDRETELAMTRQNQMLELLALK